MNKKVLFCFIYIFIVCIAISAQWSSIAMVWNYSNAYFSSTGTQCIDSDNAGNTYVVWYDHTFDFYFDIMTYEFDGTSWANYQRVEDGLTGNGDYALSWMPSLSVEPTGERLIVWEDYRTGYFELYSKYYDGLGTPTQLQITNDSSYSWYPKLQFKNNVHHLFYINNQSDYFNIYYNYFDSDWHVSENVIAIDSACRDFSYHVFPDSSIVLAFTMINDEYENLYFIKRNNNVWSLLPLPIQTGNFDIYNPNIISNDTYTYILYTAYINGLSQVFLSKYNGTSWSSPKIVSNNSSNATFPTGILNSNELYIFYVSDIFPNGIIINRVYDADVDTLILEETVVNERDGFIYTPQVTIDASGDMQLLFTCGDTDFSGSRGPNNIYQITKSNVTFNIVNKDKPYSLKYGIDDIMFSSNSNFPMNITVFDKMGRFIKSYNNITSLRMNNNVFVINDVYFLLINNGKQQYSEKVLWLK